jgi:hypothetical protein
MNGSGPARRVLVAGPPGGRVAAKDSLNALVSSLAR